MNKNNESKSFGQFILLWLTQSLSALEVRQAMRLYSGCIDKDETPKDCIIRECYEELGIEGAFKYLD